MHIALFIGEIRSALRFGGKRRFAFVGENDVAAPSCHIGKNSAPNAPFLVAS